MSQLSLADWKLFLKARIDQEQGNDNDALNIFDKLLQKYPDDPHLLASRTFALSRLDREEEARASHVATKYAMLGRTLIGEQDIPERWAGELKNVLGDIEELERGGKISASLVMW